MTPDELRRRIAGVPNWYHVLELAPGVATPGMFDMRPFTDRFGFPASLAGASVLDVGASNGFFTFHLERLGPARIVAHELASVVDHDVPRWYLAERREGMTEAELARLDHLELEAGFELGRDVYGSRAERLRCHVNAIGDRTPGEFDLAFCSNLLHHLRDPVAALESVRAALRPGGTMILGVSCDLSVQASYALFSGVLEPHVLWWILSREAAERMCAMAGFRDVRWRDSFEFSPTDRPESVGTLGILHAVAP